MTAQAGSKAHIWKCEIAIPESVAPATKPNHRIAVNLPEVQVVGLQSAERLFEHLRGKRSVATVGADLCHQEDLVAPTFKAQAEPGLSFAAIVFPRIAVKRDTTVEGAVNDMDRSLLVLGATKMVAAQAECGDLDACFTEVSKRDRHVPPSQRKGSIATKAESGPEPGVAVNICQEFRHKT